MRVIQINFSDQKCEYGAIFQFQLNYFFSIVITINLFVLPSKICIQEKRKMKIDQLLLRQHQSLLKSGSMSLLESILVNSRSYPFCHKRVSFMPLEGILVNSRSYPFCHKRVSFLPLEGILVATRGYNFSHQRVSLFPLEVILFAARGYPCCRQRLSLLPLDIFLRMRMIITSLCEYVRIC